MTFTIIPVIFSSMPDVCGHSMDFPPKQPTHLRVMCPPPARPYDDSTLFSDLREPIALSTPQKKPLPASVNAPFKVPRRIIQRQDSLLDTPQTRGTTIKDEDQRAPLLTDEVIERHSFRDNGSHPVKPIPYFDDTQEDVENRLDTYYEHRFPYFLTNWKGLAGAGYYCVDRSHQLKCAGCGHSNPGLWFWRFSDITKHHGEACPFGSTERKA